MRCARCGNENVDTNRFCGMCGSPLSSAPAQAPATQPTRAASAAQSAPQPASGAQAAATAQAEPRLPAARPVNDGPVITEPSFLGLNQPAPGSARSASLRPSQDHALDHLRSSRNLDYLLEDEEEPKRGFGKALLILVALALALGFGYLRWKQGGFDWITASAKKPPAAQTSDTSPPASDSTAAPAAAAPSSGTAPPSTADGTNASNPNATSSAANPATSPAANNPAPASPSAGPASGNAANAAAGGAPAAAAPSGPAGTPATPNESTTAPSKTSDARAAATPQPAPEKAAPSPDAEAAPPKPAPVVKPTPAKPVDPVAEAEKYIYGRGVRQNCDRGLGQLKPAAEHSNPKAMISLGALYATGVCAPRDLPTAYRWFALALRKEPDNDALQENLQRIWSQMTPPERQLAIQLSQ